MRVMGGFLPLIRRVGGTFFPLPSPQLLQHKPLATCGGFTFLCSSRGQPAVSAPALLGFQDHLLQGEPGTPVKVGTPLRLYELPTEDSSWPAVRD